MTQSAQAGADASGTGDLPRRKIHVPQRGFYFMWGMYLFIFLFFATLTVLYLSAEDPSFERIEGRRGAWKLMLLVYSLPVIWPALIAGFLWLLLVFNKNYPRVIEIESEHVDFHMRDGNTKRLNALAITAIKKDGYGNLHFSTPEKKHAASIGMSQLRKDDRAWVALYVDKVCAFLRQEGRPVSTT